jgi:hypothetical protein
MLLPSPTCRDGRLGSNGIENRLVEPLTRGTDHAASDGVLWRERFAVSAVAASASKNLARQARNSVSSSAFTH